MSDSREEQENACAEIFPAAREIDLRLKAIRMAKAFLDRLDRERALLEEEVANPQQKTGENAYERVRSWLASLPFAL